MKNKEGSFRVILIVMFITMVIALNWEKWAFLQNAVHAVLDPTAGALLNWNLTIGMLLVVLVITLITSLVQKYTTDQDALKALKEEQKAMQDEMKKHRGDTKKMQELQKKQMAAMPETMKKTFKLSMGSIIYTGIPFVLFFRWFDDFFRMIEETTGTPFRFLGFLSWFWFYFITTLIFSSIIRKKLKIY